MLTRQPRSLCEPRARLSIMISTNCYRGMIPRRNRGFRRYDAWVRSSMPINTAHFVGSQFLHEAGPNSQEVVKPVEVDVTRVRRRFTRRGGHKSRSRRLTRRGKQRARAPGNRESRLLTDAKELLTAYRAVKVAFKDHHAIYAKKSEGVKALIRDRNVSHTSRPLDVVHVHLYFTTRVFGVRKRAAEAVHKGYAIDDVRKHYEEYYDILPPGLPYTDNRPCVLNFHVSTCKECGLILFAPEVPGCLSSHAIGKTR